MTIGDFLNQHFIGLSILIIIITFIICACIVDSSNKS
jgi:hypothetical protein